MKNFVIFCVSVTLGSILFSIGWSTYYSIKGDEIHAYDRFHTENVMGSKFNPWGIISPLQIEKQSIINDTIHFKHKVVYPCAKNCLDKRYENFISDEIYKFISDTIEKVEINNQLDYDRTSYGVRRYKNPEIRTANKPYVSFLALIGNASPEWVAGYGFEKSIQPGHIEKENLQLAKERLFNISKILEQKGFPVNNKKIAEIQLSKELVKSAMKDKNTLNEMRYVEAKGDIVIQKVKVSIIVTPLLFSLWFILFLLLVYKIFKLFRFNNLVYKLRTILIQALMFIGGMSIIIASVVLIMSGLFLPLIIIITIICLWLLRGLIISLLLIIVGAVSHSIEFLRKWYSRKRRMLKLWWRIQNSTQKVICILLLPYSILVTILVIYLLLK